MCNARPAARDGSPIRDSITIAYQWKIDENYKELNAIVCSGEGSCSPNELFSISADTTLQSTVRIAFKLKGDGSPQALEIVDGSSTGDQELINSALAYFEELQALCGMNFREIVLGTSDHVGTVSPNSTRRRRRCALGIREHEKKNIPLYRYPSQKLVRSVFTVLWSAGETEYVRVADALYPESRTWLDIERTPVLSSHFQQGSIACSKVIVIGLSTSDPFESADCLFIQRALEPSEIKSFHLVDIGHDWAPDIVYVGSAQCAEGGATVIWYGTKNGFVVRSPALLPVRLLRVSSNGAQTISVSEGCCGDPVDKYPHRQFIESA